MPKEMLPLVDKPLIQYAVEEAVDSGIEHIIIITGRGKSAIEDHFDVSFELESLLEEKHAGERLTVVRDISEMADVAYVRQKKALGLGHAVLRAKDLVGREPFAVVLADDVIASSVPCLKQLITVYEQQQASVIALMEVPKDRISAYGVVDAEAVNGSPGVFRIKRLVEKPKADAAPSNLAIIGRYVLAPEIFETIERTGPGANGEIQLTDALNNLLEQKPVYGLKFEGTRYDAGDKLGFLKATVEFALMREDLGSEFRSYLQSLHLA